MKSSLFFAWVLWISICVGGCSTSQELTEPQKFLVSPNVLAMNLSIAGKPLSIENGKNGWEGQTHSRLLVTRNNEWFVNSNLYFVDVVGANATTPIYANYFVSLPKMEISDTSRLTTEYTPQTLFALFPKGKQVMQGKGVPNGYHVLFSYVNTQDMAKSYGYNTIDGDQEGSKWEITAVKQLTPTSIVVTYSVDCKLYSRIGDVVKMEGKMIGTIQAIVQYKKLK